MIIWGLVFVLSLAGLIGAAEFFIRASERTGLALGVSPFIIGITLVAVGTSLPELISSILAVLAGSSEIVLGNVIGSNISNMCLILGITGILARKIHINFDITKVDLPMMMGATFLLALLILDGNLALYEGVICLVGMGIYLMYVLSSDSNDDSANDDDEDIPELDKPYSWREPVILLLSSAAIYFSAHYLIHSIIAISQALQIGTEIIALTAVALGTSLPELVVSIVAVRRNNAEIAVGNVLGSNIFNIFAVVGIPRLIGELTVAPSLIEFSLPVLVATTILCYFIVQDKVVTRWEGLTLFLFYLFFIIHISVSMNV